MLQAFSLSQICAPVPADLSLPGSKKAPGRVPPFALYHRLPQDSSSLAPLRPSPPTSRERQRAALSRGGGGSVPRRQCGTAKRSFPPHSPACRAQAHSEPVPQSGTPKLFTLHSSLFSILSPSPAPPFPSGTDSKTKIYFVFWSLDT